MVDQMVGQRVDHSVDLTAGHLVDWMAGQMVDHWVDL